MTAPSDRPIAFHIGIAVHDLDATARRYEQIFGPLQWQRWESPLPAMPWDPESSAARLKIAYGRMPGMTFELIQVLAGETVHTAFLRRHGEGVHHLGVWTPDVQAAAAVAVAAGATVRAALLGRDGTMTVQLTPTSTPEEIVSAIHPGAIAYLDLGAGGLEVEFVGPGSLVGLRQVLGAAFDNVIVAPDWGAGG